MLQIDFALLTDTVIVPIFMGRAADEFAENIGEMAAVVKGKIHCYIGYAHVGIPQHHRCMADFGVQYIGVQRHGGCPLYQTVDIVGMIIKFFGQHFTAQGKTAIRRIAD